MRNHQLSTFANTQVPVFFSQYGCNLGSTGSRKFQETKAIYSPRMTTVFSGGIAYEFYDSPEIQTHYYGYGLVREEETPVGKGVTLLADYHNLKSQLEAAEAAAKRPGGAAPVELPAPSELEAANGQAGDIPALAPHWKAGHALPYSVGNWGNIQKTLSEKAWVDVAVEQIETVAALPQRPAIRA